MANKEKRSHCTSGHLITASDDWVPYHEVARDPVAWAMKADELRLAARILARECGEWARCLRESASRSAVSRTRSPMKQYLLLSAFSIENYLKALMIRQNPQLAGKNGLEREIATHDLVQLAKSAGLRPSKSARSFLALLTCAAVEFGRYPASASRRRYISHRMVTGDPVAEVERLSRTLRVRLARGTDSARMGHLPRWRPPSGSSAIPQSWQWT